jgi:hypothetical protein
MQLRTATIPGNSGEFKEENSEFFMTDIFTLDASGSRSETPGKF